MARGRDRRPRVFNAPLSQANGNRPARSGKGQGKRPAKLSQSLPPALKRHIYPSVKVFVTSQITDSQPGKLSLKKAINGVKNDILRSLAEDASCSDLLSEAKRYCNATEKLSKEIELQLQHEADRTIRDGEDVKEGKKKKKVAAELLKKWFGTANASVDKKKGAPSDLSANSKTKGKGGKVSARDAKLIAKIQEAKAARVPWSKAPGFKKADIPPPVFDLLTESIGRFLKPHLNAGCSEECKPFTSQMVTAAFPQFVYRSLISTHSQDMHDAAKVISEHEPSMRGLIISQIRRIVGGGGKYTPDQVARSRKLLAAWNPKPTPTPRAFLSKFSLWPAENALPVHAVPEQITKAIARAVDECVRGQIKRAQAGRSVTPREALLTDLFPSQHWPSDGDCEEDLVFEASRCIARHRATIVDRLGTCLSALDRDGIDVSQVRQTWFPAKRARGSSCSSANSDPSTSPPRGDRKTPKKKSRVGTAPDAISRMREWGSDCDSSLDMTMSPIPAGSRMEETVTQASPLKQAETAPVMTERAERKRKKKKTPFVFSV